ncbi:factor 14 [Tyrophagus putrescentiae]|nr:factor 14 [Tyrophagus putrescentiae]
MFSPGSHLSFSNSSVMHSFVDSFFEGKKALVKERLMDSVRVIVDGLFEEMVGQVKEMMMPPPPKERAENDQLKANAASTTTSPKPTTSVPPSQPPNSNMVFATKSKPGPSSSSVPLSQPFSGLYKRMDESDGGNNSQPNKKKAITVELQIDDPLDDDEEDDYSDVDLDDGAGGGGIEQLDNIASSSKQQPKQRAEKKVACPEPGCGKLLVSFHLKRHLRTHSGVKPYFCNFPLCEMECATRQQAIRHIVAIHHRDYIEDGVKPPDPETWLVIKEHLL